MSYFQVLPSPYLTVNCTNQKHKQMEKLSLFIGVIAAILGLALLSHAAETPPFMVVYIGSDFEVRLYSRSTWMTTFARFISFEKATMVGFHRLSRFIHGANLNGSRIPMTVPIVTSIIPGAGPLHSAAYSIRFNLPEKFQSMPPIPLPELRLRTYNWSNHFVAVRKFSGYTLDATIVDEAEQLASSLRRSPWANATSTNSHYAYSIAQYNSPFQLSGRINEVWVDVNVSAFHGSSSAQVV